MHHQVHVGSNALDLLLVSDRPIRSRNMEGDARRWRENMVEYLSRQVIDPIRPVDMRAGTIFSVLLKFEHPQVFRLASLLHEHGAVFNLLDISETIAYALDHDSPAAI
jgi:hypothetical protein